MTEQELRIARLSKIMNSGLRVKSGNNKTSLDAYDRVVANLEKRIEEEKLFNQSQEKKQRLLEMAEREQEMLKDSIYKHHFNVLQKQIEEKNRNRMISEKEEIVEKELSEETYKPKKFNIKELLDAQVEEKKKIVSDLKEKEDALDRFRLDLARRSLESEMRNKLEGKLKLQDQLRESWEKTKNTTQLQKKIDRLRRFGDNYIIDSENESEDLGKDEEVLRRYDKIIGKKQREEKVRKSSQDVVQKSELKKKRSKSSISHMSKTSQKEVLDKISELNNKQDKIKREKLEILSYLESKTHSKASSRPVTVSSLLNSTLNNKT